MASVSINGLDALVRGLRELGEDVDKIVDNSLSDSASAIEHAMTNKVETITASYNGHEYRAYDPTHGSLRDSITSQKIQNGYTVGSRNCDHALFVEYGTGSAGDPSVPHTARPKWVYRDAEGFFHTAYPQPPRSYLRSTFNEQKDKVIERLRNDIFRAFKAARR